MAERVHELDAEVAACVVCSGGSGPRLQSRHRRRIDVSAIASPGSGGVSGFRARAGRGVITGATPSPLHGYRPMTNHRLDAAPDTVHWGYLRCLADAGPHDRQRRAVTISTVSGGADQMPAPPLRSRRRSRPSTPRSRRKLGPHICTGPVAVRGAKPGQVLQVESRRSSRTTTGATTWCGPLARRAAARLRRARADPHPARPARKMWELPWGPEVPLRRSSA